MTYAIRDVLDTSNTIADRMLESACASYVSCLRHYMAAPLIQHGMFLVQVYYNKLFINDLRAQLLCTTNILHICK